MEILVFPLSKLTTFQGLPTLTTFFPYGPEFLFLNIETGILICKDFFLLLCPIKTVSEQLLTIPEKKKKIY